MSWINKFKNKTNLLLGLFLSQLFLVSNAFAQFAEPGAADISRSFLNEIFGGLLDGGSNAFGASIATFNGAILTVGGILAAYTILAGTLGTAHDGEMLGKKFSSVYVPIRYALGTALVLPILTGGYCVMQALVMWVVMQGAGLGNIVWKAYSNSPPALQVKVSDALKKSIQKFVDDSYVAQVCVAANAQAYKDKPPVLAGMMDVQYKAKLDDNTWKFGDQGGRLGNRTSCGQISYPKKPEVQNTSSGQTITSLSGVENMFKISDLTPIYAAHTAQIDAIVNATGTMAAQAIIDPKSVSYSTLENLTNNYVNALNTAAAGVAGNQQALNNSANKEGWFLAGAWLTKIIFEQNKINAMTNQTGIAKIVIYNNDDGYSDEFNRYSANGYSAIVEKRPELTTGARNAGGSEQKNQNKTTTGGTISEYISEFIVGINLEEIKSDTRHPLIIMVHVGDKILTSVLVGLGGAVVLAAATGALTGGAVATVVFTTLAMPLTAFIATGAMLTYILPNLPFMIWIGIIIGWTIMVVEAVIAAPLWAVMHLHPNGDDLTGRGGNGYMLLLGLLLRPVLIIFGLIASIVLSGLFGQLVNKVFFDVFSANMGDSGVGFFAMIFGTGIYAAIMMTVIKQTFNLMHVIPDQLMRWIGGGGEQLGQYAGGFSGEGMAKAAAAGGAAVGYMANAAVKDTGQLAGQYAQLKAQKDGNNAQKQAGYSKADADWGGGSGEIMSRIDSTNKKDQKGATSEKSNFASAMDSLGGKNSEAAASYRSDIAETLEQNPGMSFTEAHNSIPKGGTQTAFEKAFDKQYGEGSHQAAVALASEKGPAGSASYNSQFDRASSSFANKLHQFGGGDAGKAALGEVLSNARSTHANNEPINVKGELKQSSSLGNHLQHHSDIKKAELSIPTRGIEHSEAEPAPAPEPPPPATL
jgi:conjugal transfer/type IV secretion protein DotA/TraY